MLAPILMLAPALLASAPPKPASVYLPKVFPAPNGLQLPYRLYIPPAARAPNSPRFPLVLWLHDILGVGSNNLRQISGSNAFAASLFVSPETQSAHPSFVLAPQCPRGQLWSNPFSRRPSRALAAVLDLLDSLESQYPIDPARIYLAGQSMGGYAVWSLLAARPNAFAAAIVAAGAGRPSQAPSFASTPVWIFHGAWDLIVPVFEARRMRDALIRAGASPRYTEFPTLGHGNPCWRRIFTREPTLIPWLFSHVNQSPPP